MTADLQRTRDALQPGQSQRLTSTGVSFGTLKRRANGDWDTRHVEGLPPQSLTTLSPTRAPSLIVRPWQVSGTTVSIREITNTSLNQHFGMQSSERFGVGTDPDGDGVANEVTRGDVTALVAYQAALQVPGRVIPRDPEIERAVAAGERLFSAIGCTQCHVPSLKLAKSAWVFSEPGPYNPPGNHRRPTSRLMELDLTNAELPLPRLMPSAAEPNMIDVPAYTDFKLHDITDPSDGQAKEPLDLNQRIGSAKFLRVTVVFSRAGYGVWGINLLISTMAGTPLCERPSWLTRARRCRRGERSSNCPRTARRRSSTSSPRCRCCRLA